MFPEKTKKFAVVVMSMAALLLSTGAFALHPNAPESTSEALHRVANRLVATQIQTGSYKGAWPSIGGVPVGTFTGTMAAGLADAYWMTCNPAYKAAAEKAGDFIWATAPGCSLFFDEAFAFMQLSQIACDPSDNLWRTALVDFYSCLESQPPDPEYGYKEGTQLFIAQIEGALSPAYAAFEVAYYTVVAYYVDTPDKAIWREKLIDLLESNNADSGQQIFTLGAATWALAQTGDLDETPIFVGSGSWGGFPGGAAVKLQQLPPLLASYQLSAAAPTYGNHFYSIYNPPNPGFSGWTETNIYAAMGLAAATEYAGYDYRNSIDRVWAVNMQPVDLNGDIWYDAIDAPATGDNERYYHYAGEYLQYLSAVRLPGDINLDDAVDIADLSIFAINWLQTTECSCSIADLSRDREVNLIDFAELSRGWFLSR